MLEHPVTRLENVLNRDWALCQAGKSPRCDVVDELRAAAQKPS